MAERLTEYVTKNCSEPFYRFNENSHISVRYKYCANIDKAINKLGKLEDILEKYGIESLDTLEHIIKKGQVITSTIEDFAKEEYDKMKQDRDTWKKACELACEREDDCYVYDNIHRAYEFYQQAKKEGDLI